ncbi:hypothetical protein Baya_5052 [Bagarius yarrelli]|uniref:Uncharacterized protein n=1 Tax=Bagarius yarrelli TaxID=175774 RepID=A0A556TV76_BAGYA|nr:hypothetical protein Baya_5052 [Bagarius yarrelli]
MELHAGSMKRPPPLTAGPLSLGTDPLQPSDLPRHSTEHMQGQFLRVIVGRQGPHSASAGSYNRRPALAFGLLCLELKRPQQETLFLLHSPGATATP